MKRSISLGDAHDAKVRRYMKHHGVSFSAAVQQAIELLPDPGLVNQYAAAWDEWNESGQADAWDATAGDGIASGVRASATR